jgi:hypothetical protein
MARLQEILDQFDFSEDEITASGAREAFVQALVLRDLANGDFKQRINYGDGLLPLSLKNEEIVVWIFQGVTRLEPKTSVSYVGRSQGISFRVMKGVSYRVGASQGHRVETTTLANKGSGNLVVTSVAAYFSCPTANYRVTHRTITAVDQFSDGISISPNRGKTQFFMFPDTRFATELILRIGSLS